MESKEYKVQYISKQVNLADYMAKYRDVEKFLKCCKVCPQYTKTWICPPLDESVEEYLRSYKSILLIAVKIIPEQEGLPMSESHRFIHTERVRFERMLLEMEQKYEGRAFPYVGTCLHCPDGTCTRLTGEPCRHPDLARPSLEAAGFDLGRTASELLGTDILWGYDGKIPAYLTLIGGLLHNRFKM